MAKKTNSTQSLAAKVRAAVSRSAGVPISRKTLAKLLDASEGSILNWEKGTTEITATNVAKLKDLLARANTGKIALPPRGKVGRPPKNAKVVADDVGDDFAPSSRADFAVPGVSSDVLYANTVSVHQGQHDKRLVFGLVVPGSASKTVIQIVVPSGLALS